MERYEIKKIKDNRTYLQIKFTNGLNFNTEDLTLIEKFKEGETVLFQSGRNITKSQIFKLQ